MKKQSTERISMTIREITYCMEHQLFPDTRLILMVSGMISFDGEKPAYFRWVEDLWDNAVLFCMKEGLI